MDIRELSGMKWWINKRKKHYLTSFLILFFTVVFFAFCFFASERQQPMQVSEIVPLALLGLVFAGFMIRSLKAYISSNNLQISQYWFGTVTNMDIEVKRRSNGKTRRIYWIEADVEGKRMAGVCTATTYSKAEIGQKILLFTLESEKVFAVHPDM